LLNTPIGNSALKLEMVFSFSFQLGRDRTPLPSHLTHLQTITSRYSHSFRAYSHSPPCRHSPPCSRHSYNLILNSLQSPSHTHLQNSPPEPHIHTLTPRLLHLLGTKSTN